MKGHTSTSQVRALIRSLLNRGFYCLQPPHGVTLSATALREGDRMVGETISHYKVLEKIGQGDMGKSKTFAPRLNGIKELARG